MNCALLFLTLLAPLCFVQSNDREKGSRTLNENFSKSALKEFEALFRFTQQNPRRIFPKCDAQPRSSKSQCYGSDTSYFRRDVPQFLKQVQCLEPTSAQLELVNVAVEKFVDPYGLSIIKSRADQCGDSCKRRLSCCGSKSSFYLQGIKSEACSTRSCEVEPLTEEEMKYLGVEKNCNFDFLGFADWELVQFGSKLMSEGLGEMNRRLMCRLFGVKRPRMNCVRYRGKCRCCCHDKKPIGSYCVPLRSNECG